MATESGRENFTVESGEAQNRAKRVVRQSTAKSQGRRTSHLTSHRNSACLSETR